MGIPHIKEKYNSPAILTAAAFTDYLRSQGRLPHITLPQTVFLTYQPLPLQFLRQNHRLEKLRLPGAEIIVPQGANAAFALNSGMGAPSAAGITELCAQLGARRFINFGAAGGIWPNAALYDTVICTQAIRDEGTSYHYLPELQPAQGHAELNACIAAALETAVQPFKQAPCWTTDAPYRETVAEIEHYGRGGVAAVDMEAAAVFSVAQSKGLEASAVFVISDVLRPQQWQPSADKGFSRNFNKIFKLLAEEFI